MKKLLLLMLIMLSTAVTYAGGYRVALQGQRALAMGHTGVAVVNSAELGFFNPSGLVYLENKINISA
ncbi:MAG TPA: transporter, partial [Gillisia sp.]|nr:transporter [Gillisia sp.]